MLTWALWIFWTALAAGLVLGFFHLRGRAFSWSIGAVHGIWATMGLGILVFALRNGPVRGVQYGVSSFGKFAGILAAIAFTIGIVYVLLPEFSRRATVWLLSAHATVGIAACVLLLAYVSLG